MTVTILICKGNFLVKLKALEATDEGSWGMWEMRSTSACCGLGLRAVLTSALPRGLPRAAHSAGRSCTLWVAQDRGDGVGGWGPGSGAGWDALALGDGEV